MVAAVVWWFDVVWCLGLLPVVCWLSWCVVLLSPSVLCLVCSRFGMVTCVAYGCCCCLFAMVGFCVFSGLFLGLVAYLFASCCGYLCLLIVDCVV